MNDRERLQRWLLIAVYAMILFFCGAIIGITVTEHNNEETVVPEAPVEYEEANLRLAEAAPYVMPAAEEEPDPLAGAQQLGEAKVTFYCLCQKCCGKAPDHPAYGITASGRPAVSGTSVAVDPALIPLGSEVLIDYGDGVIHSYSADDTGSGVDGKHIDVCSEDHQTALTLGVKTASVWFIAPEK